MTEILYQEEVAAKVKRPLSTLRYWRHVGKGGPKSFKLGGRVVYKLEDVEQWIETQYNDDTAGDRLLRPAGPLTSTRLPKGIDLKVNGYCIVPPRHSPGDRAPVSVG